MSVKRRAIDSDDYLRVSNTQKRFNDTVDITAIKRVFDAGLLKDYKSLKTTDQYIMFSGYDVAGDLGMGLYMRVDTDEPADIGVILNIRGIRYRRVYTGSVYLEWFGTDFASALAAASKYRYVRLASDKTYELNRQLILKLTNDLIIDMNGSRIHSTVVDNNALTIEFVNKGIQLSITKGYISSDAQSLFSFKTQSNASFIDCNTMVVYEPATIAPNTDYILSTRAYTPRPIDSLKDFTQPVECTSQVFDDNSLITNGYIQANDAGANIVRINKDADILGAKYQVAPVIPDTPDTENTLVNEAFLDTVVDELFTELMSTATYNVLNMPIGSIYIQVAVNGNFEKQDEPESLFAGTYWIEYQYVNKATLPLGVSTTSKLANVDSSTGTLTIAGLKVKLWQRVDAKLTQAEINSFTVTPMTISGAVGTQETISVTTTSGLRYTYTLTEQTGNVAIAGNTVTLNAPGSYVLRVTIAVSKGSAVEYIVKNIAVTCKISDIVLDTANFRNGELSYTNNLGMPIIFNLELPDYLYRKISPSIYSGIYYDILNPSYGLNHYSAATFYTRTSSDSTARAIQISDLKCYNASVTGNGSGYVSIEPLGGIRTSYSNRDITVGISHARESAIAITNNTRSLSLNEYTLLPGETFYFGCKSRGISSAPSYADYTDTSRVLNFTVNSSGSPASIVSGERVVLRVKAKQDIIIAPDLFVDGEYTWTNNSGAASTFKIVLPSNVYSALVPQRLYNSIAYLNPAIRFDGIGWIAMFYIKRNGGARQDLTATTVTKSSAIVNPQSSDLYLSSLGGGVNYNNAKVRVGLFMSPAPFNTQSSFLYGSNASFDIAPITLNDGESITIGIKYLRHEYSVSTYETVDVDVQSFDVNLADEPAKLNDNIVLKFL